MAASVEREEKGEGRYSVHVPQAGALLFLRRVEFATFLRKSTANRESSTYSVISPNRQRSRLLAKPRAALQLCQLPMVATNKA